MNASVLTTRVADRIAVITLGSARRIYFDQEMGAETVYQRTRTGAHAFLCGGERHLTVALYRGRRRLNHD